MSRYINPYTDFGFKKLFGEEANKNLLIDFLNAVLPAERRVENLHFRNPEQLPDNVVDRRAIFDIACEGENGEQFTVEMQKAKQHYFRDRALFYTSYPIQRQAQKGDWNFKLNPVFLVAVLDFEYDVKEERRKIYRFVQLRDQDGDIFSENLNMIFLQMPLFRLQEHELKTPQDKWLYFLKNLDSFDNIPSILREPVFEQAFETAEYIKLPPKLQEAYQENLKTYRDNTNVVNTARDDGFLAGEINKALEIARKMKQRGISVAEVAELTGLPQNEIEKL
jgi:predicted transposase/invertase (TIGR01784 family)